MAIKKNGESRAKIECADPAPREDAPPSLFEKLALELDAIMAEDLDRVVKINDLRRVMDPACDSGQLSIKQWRVLIDKVAIARSSTPIAKPRAGLPPSIA